MTTATNYASFKPAVLHVTPEGTGHLIGTRCPTCGAHFFPPRAVCSRCLTEDLQTVGLSDAGTLYTFTVIHQSTPGFQIPYVLGYVDLPEGVRVLAQIGVAAEQARIGMPLDLSIEPFGEDKDGNPMLGYRFRPARGSGAGTPAAASVKE
ncbi:MAG: Zn-ribbon domain-containing OB-fold protein [Acidobacteria bacterium]|nr:Zn-ribbon domain-containing OB-fold protein [Acidobacteriota bacterium]